ncbi:MAG: hypothetical protein HRT35_11695 [Algicola sp.]|nr:hypothetical protein [Algicola sp.]
MSSITDVLNKLKQLPQAQINQLVAAAGLIYIASIMANVTWMVLPGGVVGATFTPPGMADSRSSEVVGQSLNIRALTTLNIFGQYVAKTVVTDEPKPDSQQRVIPPTTLDLTLTATVTENIDGKGTAVIASSGLQGTYSMGEKIDSTPAIVKQVYFDRVIIQNGDKRETLMLDGIVYDNKNVATPIRSPDSRR